MATNEFLTFCNTDTGTNLLTEAEYTASTDRTSGNKPGVASSKLNNKALRQSAAIANVVAQYLGDRSASNVLDDGVTARLLAQFTSVMTPYAPAYTKYTSGSGTHALTYIFNIATGSATIGATYTNNAITFTVKATVASGVVITMTGGGPPSASGTLTKASGTGDSTLTFYAYRAPAYMRVRLVGGGAGGNGGGSGGIVGTTGSDTTFKTTGGSALLVGTKGAVAGNANLGGAGGAASLGTGPTGVNIPGSAGASAAVLSDSPGGNGGCSFYGGAGGGGGNSGLAGIAAAANSGSGGGGGGSGTGGAGGGGGGAGGFVDAVINAPVVAYDYGVGSAGSGGAAGTGGGAGAAGAAGIIEVWEIYQ